MFRTLAAALLWISMGTHAWADDCAFGSPLEAKLMAEQAAAYLEKHGAERAFRDFMDPDGPFFDRDLYVFVFDMRGVMWVNGGYPNAIGVNIAGASDRYGQRFGLDMLRMAQNVGHGWVDYQLQHPCTGEVMPKATYLIRVGPFVVAAGAFGTVST